MRLPNFSTLFLSRTQVNNTTSTLSLHSCDQIYLIFSSNKFRKELCSWPMHSQVFSCTYCKKGQPHCWEAELWCLREPCVFVYDLLHIELQSTYLIQYVIHELHDMKVITHMWQPLYSSLVHSRLSPHAWYVHLVYLLGLFIGTKVQRFYQFWL